MISSKHIAIFYFFLSLLSDFESMKSVDSIFGVTPAVAETVALPSNSKYWQYQRQYLESSAVDLFVSGTSGDHLTKALEAAAALKEKGVAIRRIVVIGGTSFPILDTKNREQQSEAVMLQQLTRDLRRVGKSISSSSISSIEQQLGMSPELYRVSGRLQLQLTKPVPGYEQLLKELDINSSPTWVVKSKGKEFIYEGIPSIEKQFEAGGRFSMESANGNLHMKRQSSVVFVKKESSHLAAPDSRPTVAMEYTLKDAKPLPGAGTYDAKVDCSSSQVRRTKVLYDSEELSEFDFVFFNYLDSNQTAGASRREGLSIPYLEGDLDNPYRDKGNRLQDYGRFLDIRCLPTRVFYPYIQGERYEEYREGESAWK